MLITPFIFKNNDRVTCRFSTKISPDKTATDYFDLSLSETNPEAAKNRNIFFNYSGFHTEQIAYHKQIHSDKIKYVEKSGYQGEGDALVTDKSGIPLVVSAADCTTIFIFDPVKNVIAAIHSGWRGTEKKITQKTVEFLTEEFGCSPENFLVYIGPSISQINYEVGSEVAEKFGKKYSKPAGSKFLLDVSSMNHDMLIESGVKSINIQKSSLCTFLYKDILHSYRRDGEKSGRMLGLIALS